MQEKFFVFRNWLESVVLMGIARHDLESQDSLQHLRLPPSAYSLEVLFIWGLLLPCLPGSP